MMPRVSQVDEFVATSIAGGLWKVDDRDRLYDMAQSGASSESLLRFLRDKGFQGSKDSVEYWRRSNGGIGALAAQMNMLTRECRGLMPSDALNQLSFWMLDILRRLFEELAKRPDLDKVATKDLLFLISTYGGKVQAAIAEADKIRTLHDNKDLILGTLEEVRISWRQSYEAENPEMLQLIDAVLDMTRVKLDL